MTTVPRTSLDDYLRSLPGRCGSCGYHVRTQGHGPACAPVAPVGDAGQAAPVADEWAIFLAAVRKVAAENGGTVYQSDRPDGRPGVRSLIRGRIAPRHVGTLYRRAKAEGILRDTGEREESNDFAGRNADKLDRIYELRSVA